MHHARQRVRRPWLTVVASLGLILLVGACTYKDRVAPLNLPDAKRDVTVAGGLRISAEAFTDAKKAEQTFGFDAHGAGLLPVQVTFQNDSQETVYVNADQTFLVDRNNKAWPILSLEKTHQRTQGHVDIGETAKETAKPALLLGAAGAIAGAAIGIVTGDNVGEAAGKGAVLGAAAGAILGGAKGYATGGEKVREDLASKRLSGGPILPNQIAYGVLFFPGMGKDEAQGATELRLALTIGRQNQIVRLPLQ
ncbi:MAG: hypothetical protein ACOY8P_01345 [Thermodesulfobacteriota bacterium]